MDSGRLIIEQGRWRGLSRQSQRFSSGSSRALPSSFRRPSRTITARPSGAPRKADVIVLLSSGEIDDPWLTPDAAQRLLVLVLVSLLEQNADPLGGYTGWNQYFGYGQVDAYKAVLAAQTAGSRPAPPSVSITSPGNGASVSRTLSVQGTASAGAGLASIQFSVDSALVGLRRKFAVLLLVEYRQLREWLPHP